MESISIGSFSYTLSDLEGGSNYLITLIANNTIGIIESNPVVGVTGNAI